VLADNITGQRIPRTDNCEQHLRTSLCRVQREVFHLSLVGLQLARVRVSQ